MAAGQASVAAGGTVYANPSSTPPFQGTSTTVAGGITGTVLVNVPATSSVTGSVTGVWAEISGKTLNTTMTLDLPVQQAGEDKANYDRRLEFWYLQQGLNPDGSLMTEVQRRALEHDLFGAPVQVSHPAAQPPVHPSQALPLVHAPVQHR
jgi:hypothetical protein